MEASYEMVEGTADFVAEGTLLQMGLMTPQQISDLLITLYRKDPKWAYYPLGSIKLLILSQVSKNMTSVISGLGLSSNWQQNIDSVFMSSLALSPKKP